MEKEFNKTVITAEKAWQKLVITASRGTLITYNEFGICCGYDRWNSSLSMVLHYIARYCRSNDLPVLTTLIFSEAKNQTESAVHQYTDNLLLSVADCLNYNWRDVENPTAEKLQDAYENWNL